MMNILEAIEARHAVRDFDDRPIDDEILRHLSDAIDMCNERSGLRIQLIHDDADAFGGCPTHYGRFKNVRHCIALIGPEGEALPELAGYYGEMLAVKAVSLGLGTGWVVLHEISEHEGRWTLRDGDSMPAAIVIGYPVREGRAHKSKPLDELGVVEGHEDTGLSDAPAWFVEGVRAASLAPSALGKQPFRMTLLADGRTVRAEALEGLQPLIGLGAAKYNFEQGAQGADFIWG